MGEGNVKVHVWVPPSLCDRLEQTAREKGTNRSAFIREAIKRALDDRDAAENQVTAAAS